MDLLQSKKKLAAAKWPYRVVVSALLLLAVCLLALSAEPGAQAIGFARLGDFTVVADYGARGESPMQLAYSPTSDCLYVHLSSEKGHRLAEISPRTGREIRAWVLDSQASPGVLGAVAVEEDRGGIWVAWEATLAYVDPSADTVTVMHKPYAEGSTIGAEALAIEAGRAFVKWHDETPAVAYAHVKGAIVESIRVNTFLPPGEMVSSLGFEDGRMVISTYGGRGLLLAPLDSQPSELPVGYTHIVSSQDGRYYASDSVIAYGQRQDAQLSDIFDLGEPIQVMVPCGKAVWVVGCTKAALVGPDGSCAGAWELPSHVSEDPSGTCLTVSTCGSGAVDGAGRLWLCLSSFGLVGYVDRSLYS